MLTVLKKSGARSTAGDVAKKGNKGRLELFVSRDESTYSVRFTDYGNYGRVRWDADFGLLTRNDVEEMIAELQSLVDGHSDTTHVPFEELEAAEGVPVDDEEEVSAVAFVAEDDSDDDGFDTVQV
jgi:hypothetical protein